ncbi:unnamed protein product [Victoria cruziana]
MADTLALRSDPGALLVSRGYFKCIINYRPANLGKLMEMLLTSAIGFINLLSSPCAENVVHDLLPSEGPRASFRR